MVKEKSVALDRLIDSRFLRNALVSTVCYTGLSVEGYPECSTSSLITARIAADLMIKLAKAFAIAHKYQKIEVATSIPALIRKIFGHFLERLCDNYPLLMADLIDETEDDDYDPEVGSLGD
ncbi:MAG: hypothetical protein ABIB04_04020, partial [Patescibacteria group bacterium]